MTTINKQEVAIIQFVKERWWSRLNSTLDQIHPLLADQIVAGKRFDASESVWYLLVAFNIQKLETPEPTSMILDGLVCLRDPWSA